VTDDAGILAAAQCVRYPKKILGGYWYMPRGPILRHDALDRSADVLREFFDQVSDAELGAFGFFLRCEPPIELRRDEHPLPRAFIRAHAFQPASTSLVNLTKSEEELLSRMHEKTRYNVRLAERKGIVVRAGLSDADLEAFLRLNDATALRAKFVSHPSSYLRKTFAHLRSSGMARIRIAEFEGEALAASMEILYGDTVTYLYGASSSSKRNLMAPFALHWSAMLDAKRGGFRFYDLHGANPSHQPSPYFKASWEGITRFKNGWGGATIDFIGTWERPTRPFLYRALRLAQKIVNGKGKKSISQ